MIYCAILCQITVPRNYFANLKAKIFYGDFSAINVRWYKAAPSSIIRFKHSFMEPDVSNTELWNAEYYQEGYDSLLPVHRILCRATKFKFVTIGKKKYLSIVPLNRKFNL
jgi:hypothetical protein